MSDRTRDRFRVERLAFGAVEEETGPMTQSGARAVAASHIAALDGVPQESVSLLSEAAERGRSSWVAPYTDAAVRVERVRQSGDEFMHLTVLYTFAPPDGLGSSVSGVRNVIIKPEDTEPTQYLSGPNNPGGLDVPIRRIIAGALGLPFQSAEYIHIGQIARNA